MEVSHPRTSDDRLTLISWDDYRKHIFEDICAYTCIIGECSYTRAFFEDLDAMTNHLSLCHNINQDTPSYTCPLCVE
jgi:hypothetical protein